METLANRLYQVQEHIAEAEKAALREDTVRLLSVSKKRSAECLREAYSLGLHAFGENYLQEALDKISALKDLDIEWHFIGPMQSNKTRAIAENFSWVHTVDRLKVAQRLNDQRPAHLPPLNVCIQINISLDDNKSGITLSQLPELAQLIADMPQLTLRGLMCIPANDLTELQLADQFKQMSDALSDLSDRHNTIYDTLSMGMSGDMMLAIKQGSTMVRVGTALFGPRQ
jgi:pyridoxal phosphate enzyme (YggS family)